MSANSDFKELLSIFNDNRVSYLVVGAWERRVTVDLEGILVPFISKQDLITSKLASARPQDLIDAELLSESSD